MRRFRAPVEPTRHGIRVNLDDTERALVVRLAGELRALLVRAGEAEPGAPPDPLLARLFPPVYPDDEAKEAEYQRLMREELVASRIAQLDTLTEILGPDAPKLLDEPQAMALLQSVNAVRLVLGTMLDVGEDDDPSDDDSPEQHLYTFLSWVLDWTVRALRTA
jgi:hypothetical protein